MVLPFLRGVDVDLTSPPTTAAREGTLTSSSDVDADADVDPGPFDAAAADRRVATIISPNPVERSWIRCARRARGVRRGLDDSV